MALNARPLKINPRQLEAFRTVMVAGSVTTAARLMHVTQPAVSRLIRELESCLDLRLFERYGVSIRPTEDAVALFQEVDRSFIGLDRIATHAQALRERRTSTLRVAASAAVATMFLPQFLSRFMQQWKELNVNVAGLSQHQIANAIATDQHDVGIVGMPIDHPGVVSDLTAGFEAVAAIPSQHPLATKPYLEPKDFRGESFISLSPSSVLRLKVDAMFAEAGITRQIRVETPLATIACVLVASGSGIAIVEPFAALSFLSRGLVLKPLRPRIAHEMHFLWSAKRPLSVVASAFVEAFRREICAASERVSK